MAWIQLITVLSLAQFLYFALQVARARGRYGVKAPATTGHELFERHYRVQMNSLELLIMLLPALWIAATLVRPLWPALLGGVYLLGRLLYARSYVRDPARRELGYSLSVLPIVVLLIIDAVGALVSLRAGGP